MIKSSFSSSEGTAVVVVVEENGTFKIGITAEQFDADDEDDMEKLDEERSVRIDEKYDDAERDDDEFSSSTEEEHEGDDGVDAEIEVEFDVEELPEPCRLSTIS